jgi:hypothetical protein
LGFISDSRGKAAALLLLGGLALSSNTGAGTDVLWHIWEAAIKDACVGGEAAAWSGVLGVSLIDSSSSLFAQRPGDALSASGSLLSVRELGKAAHVFGDC